MPNPRVGQQKPGFRAVWGRWCTGLSRWGLQQADHACWPPELGDGRPPGARAEPRQLSRAPRSMLCASPAPSENGLLHTHAGCCRQQCCGVRQRRYCLCQQRGRGQQQWRRGGTAARRSHWRAGKEAAGKTPLQRGCAESAHEGCWVRQGVWARQGRCGHQPVWAGGSRGCCCCFCCPSGTIGPLPAP